MPVSIFDLATSLCHLAAQDGPLDDDCQETGGEIVSMVHLLHEEESPEQDQQIGIAVEKLTGAFASPNIERAGYVAKVCGAILEHGIMAPVLEDALSRIIDSSMAGALVFDAKLHEGQLADLEYDDAFASAGQSLTSEAVDWARMENFYPPALSVFAKSPEARRHAAQRWLSKLELFTSSNAAHWLIRMLKTLHQEPVLVIEPDMGRGFEGCLSDISSNFEVHDMLAMLIWKNRISKTPGIKRVAEMLRPYPHAGTGVWNLYNWTVVRERRLPEASDQSNSSHWIWGEGCPADIEVFEGRRVILLGPPSYPRTWNAGRELPQLQPNIQIQRWLDAAEIEAWMSRFGKPSKESGQRTNY